MRSSDLEEFPAPAEYPARGRRFPRWVALLVTVLLLAGAASVAAWNIHFPYFAFAPGPTPAVEDLITIDGTVSNAPSDLYMLTVDIGSRPVNLYEWMAAELDPAVDLVKSEAVRPAEVSYEEYRQYNEKLMFESVDLAKYVALQYLGYDPTFTGDGMLVVDTIEDTPAYGVLMPGDVITAIDGEAVRLASDGAALIRSHRPGDTILLTLQRDDETLDLPITLIEHTSDPGAAMVGFLPDTVDLHFDFPVDIQVDSSVAIGPSAGLAYTLAIINALTPGADELHGLVVAATGEITEDGEVGAVGGIRQKVLAAEAVGANVVFVPAQNYDEALTAGADITIVPVRTFEDALSWAEGHPAA